MAFDNSTFYLTFTHDSRTNQYGIDNGDILYHGVSKNMFVVDNVTLAGGMGSTVQAKLVNNYYQDNNNVKHLVGAVPLTGYFYIMHTTHKFPLYEYRCDLDIASDNVTNCARADTGAGISSSLKPGDLLYWSDLDWDGQAFSYDTHVVASDSTWFTVDKNPQITDNSVNIYLFK